MFILYIASLYEAIKVDGVVVIRFVDDTNFLSYNNDITTNCKRLESAWKLCEQWARTRGMRFAPQKSELMHFTRVVKPPQNRVRLGEAAVTPVESARFLGAWLDRTLRWRRHLKQLKAKMATQQFALTKLAASV